jgi:hypothetical protein
MRVHHQAEDLKAKLKIPAPSGWPGFAYARAIKAPLFAPGLLITMLVWEFGVLLLKSRRKLFWYDELLTFHVSNLHPFSLVWKALQAGADGMPAGYYSIVQLFTRLPGDPLVTLRLPSILGYLLSLLGVYWFARRKLPAIAGLAAVLLITLSPFRAYALEARSYCLLVGFLAISAVLWQRIGEKRFMTPLFALFLTLAVSCHHLAVVAVSSFSVAEIISTLLSRRIRCGVWAACLLATSPFFLGLPVLLRFRDIFGQNFWSQPSWDMVVSTYSSYLGLDSLLTLVLMAFFGIVVGDSLLRVWRTHGKGTADERSFTPPEIVLVGGFMYFPALLVVLTKLLHSGYTSRYGSPAILGLVLGLAYLFRTLWLKSSSIYLLGALLIVFAFQGEREFKQLCNPGSAKLDDQRWTVLAELSRSEPGIPVVIGSGITYLEAAEYAPPELRGRLIQIVDADSAIRLAGTDSVDKANRILAQFIPLRVEDLAPFRTAHQRFLLFSGGSFDWFTRYLLERRYHLKLLAKDGDRQIYIAESMNAERVL